MAHRTRPLHTVVLALAALLALAGCCRPSCLPRTRCAPCPTVRTARPCPPRAPAVRPAPQDVARQGPLDQAVERALLRARDLEPKTTAHLQALADDAGGELLGLEHRLKTPTSTRGKIQRLMEKDGIDDPRKVDVYDALRYTMRVEDEPPGHHDETVRTVLAELEAEGHTVTKVKNYWPRGDSYSGVNCRLRAADGFSWELQFHTRASFETKSAVHGDYERMRAPDTPVEEKRSLFEKMAAQWARIPIPFHILEAGSLHEDEEIVLAPAP